MISPKLKTIVIIFLSTFFAHSIFSVAVSEKAKYKRAESMNQLLFLDVPVKNFGTEENKKEYNDLRKQYSVALAFYFEENYVESYRGFLDFQKKIEKLYEKMSASYIDRTAILLQAALEGKSVSEQQSEGSDDKNEKPINDPKGAVEVEFEYNKRQNIVKRFLRNRESPKEKPLYDTKEFYYAVDKQKILNNLQEGYRLLGLSKRRRQEAMDLEKWLENDKPMDPRMRKMRIEEYRVAIESCRQAKLNAVRAFQLLRRHDIYKVQVAHAENYYAVEKKLDPVFDFRVPAEFRIDFNDSYNRIHKDEMKYKLNNENINGKDSKDSKEKK